MKKLILPAFFLTIFFFMLFFSSTTFSGALNGLNLWFFTVLPSLLPYMIISSYMTESGSFRYFSKLLSPLTTKVFGLSPHCGYVILLGFLCGYPMGSKLSADLLKKGEISATEGQILLSFCNNVSPAFLVTYLIDQTIGLPKYRMFLIFIMIGTPLLAGVFMSRYFRNFFQPSARNCAAFTITAQTKGKKESGKVSFDRCILASFENCLKLGGYIILFSILSQWIHDCLSLSPTIQNPISAFLEITTGLEFYRIQPTSELSLLTESTAFAAFGGLCCLAQTYSMIRGSGLSIYKYILAKLFLAGIVYALCTFLYFLL